MVAAVRRGQSQCAAARMFGVSISAVQYWLARAGSQRLDRVDWSDRPKGCRAVVNRTAHDVEERVLTIRQWLRQESALGECGPEAIRREMFQRKLRRVPSARTIARILERRGALDGQRRVRWKPPPRGWFLPPVAAKRAELDSFDIVEDLVIAGGHDVNVLTAISLHGGLCQAWPKRQILAKNTVDSLLAHWRVHGPPRYAKFDNAALRQTSAPRIQAAPRRRRFPRGWRMNLQVPLQGTVIYIRRTDAKGHATLLNHKYLVSATWCSRLVRAEVDLTKGEIRFYALRRRDPDRHHFLKQHAYQTPTKKFHE